MLCCKRFASVALAAAVGVAAVVGSKAIAEPKKAAEPAPAAQAAPPQLPPGWTETDMKAMIDAGTPGKMQERLIKDAGEWAGTNKMFMMPGAPPMESVSTTKITPIMDGRYVKVEVSGDFAGMGPYTGMGVNGYDNAAGKYVCTWIDNHSTGIMTGTGKPSEDGKTMTWIFDYTCPLTKKPVVMRQVETTTGPNTKKLEFFGPEPKTLKEFKMMEVEMTKK